MNEQDFVVVDGVITEYVGDETDVVIPAKIGGEKIKGIGDCAFIGTEIESLVISEGIEYIGAGAFEYGSLREITLPDSLREIGEGAFVATEIREFFLPANVTKVESNALGSEYIKKVILPETLTDIAEDAFDNELDVEIIKYPPEKAEEFKPKKEYMYMLFLDTNIALDFKFTDPVRGRKSFWLYDSYEKAKKEMFGIFDEYSDSERDEYVYGEKIPVKSFASDVTSLWLNEQYEDFYYECEDELENTTADRMIRSLPSILDSYMKHEDFNASELKKCNWENFVNKINIENKNNPSLYFVGHWGEMRKLTVTLTNTKFDPNENNTCFYIYNEGELENHWFHIEIIQLEVNEPRI